MQIMQKTANCCRHDIPLSSGSSRQLASKTFRIMRLVFLFQLVASLAVSARPLAQTVTFSESNASAMRVIAAIEKQTDYLVFFTLNLLENAKPVSISAYKMPLVEFMTAFVKDQPFGFRIDGRTIFLTEKMEEVSSGSVKPYIPLADLLAPKLIKGRVRSQEGASLPGVTFSKNKLPVGSSGTDGRFELNVEEGDTITVTAVGYYDLQFKVTSNTRNGFRAVQLNTAARLKDQKDEAQATGSYIQNVNDEIIVVMVPSFSSLNEVVVNTGYQALPKERATGSFVFVGKEQLNSRTDARLMDRLVGYVPGLQLNRRLNSETRDKNQYNIRGLNTFMSALNGPLIIVNGFPYDGDIDLINPMDVESVTLLKDAAAASIWGARAANGVIVIELKKNNTKSPLQLSFSANVNISEKKDVKYRKEMNSSDFIDLELEMFDKGYYDSDLSGLSSRLRVTSPLVNMLDDHRKGLVSDQQLNDQIAKWRNTDYRDEYTRLFLQNPVRQNYNLGISGGSNVMSYLVSGSYDRALTDNKGNYENRYTLRTVTEIKPVKNLSIEVGLLYINNLSENGSSFASTFMPVGGKNALYPYAEFQGSDGEALAIPFSFNKKFIDTAGGGRLLDYSYRPLDEIGLNSIKTKSENINLTARIKYNFKPGLSAEIRYGIDKQSTSIETINDEKSYYMREMINRWTQIDGDRTTYILPKGSRISVQDQNAFKHQFRGQLSYNNKWNGLHEVTAFVASEISQNKGSGATYSAYGYDREYKTFTNVDYTTAYPTFGGIYGKFKIPGLQSFSGNNNRMVSFLGNAAYTYDGKYVFTISGRRDASNVLGVKTNEKWKPLWSSGLAWQIHKEKFFNAGWVNLLKARITYGHSGNIFPGNGYYPIISILNGAYFTNYPYANISTPPNPEMKWEDTRMINYGLDFALFNSRLSGSIEYYDKKSTDLIALSQLDPSSGLTSMNKNVGILTGSGWDIILNSVNIQTKDFSWTTAFSLSYTKNLVKKFYGRTSNGYNLINGGESANIIEGYQMYTVFSFKSAGLDPLTGDPRGYDRQTGEISKNYAELFKDSVKDLVVNGPGMPPFTGFLRNAFRYKNFDLSFNLMYKFGAWFKEEMYRGYAFENWVHLGNYEGRWQKPGDEKHTYIPSTVYPLNNNRTSFAAYTTDFVHKADFIRLSDIRIGYSFAIKTAAKPVSLNVFAGARDLGLIWKANKVGVDPDNLYYRAVSSANIGCNVTF
ncbi:TonB-linked SusC/RagA family outer membrane protein [Pseudobacter ginsenosidimutans]|uniref:TonB-linked SusC/RagA family outer membrane protein n=2 Tax=Pseudobacter ginsenosidimutans TaxID=661488 RepID=A0A4Q7MSC0_9BACT|nr:SusC/RagA family TonB-linked outer membrane protein [Pseudobacter ginsenosidimutans]RZS71685.1 TonB-linked SusC/RagA family outer membrane protein [Pseudobacter ginsenosidimutans]